MPAAKRASGTSVTSIGRGSLRERAMARILIADDTPNNLKLLAMQLRQMGHEVESTADGKEAVDSFQAHHPDLVILDVMMPHMDGFDACRAMRAADAEVPILALTSLDDGFGNEETQAAGFTGLMHKPWSPDDLQSRLGKLLAS